MMEIEDEKGEREIGTKKRKERKIGRKGGNKIEPNVD